MALKARLANLDGLPPDVVKEYKKDGEHFVLDVEATDGVELADVSKLKRALETERTTAKQANAKLKEFEDLDPTAAREALKKVDELKTFPLDKKIEEAVKARQDDLVKAHVTEKNALVTERDLYSTQLNEMLVVNSATAAIAEAKGVVPLLLPHVAQAIRMRKDATSGKMIAEVYDPKTGNARVGDANGNPMTIPQLVAEYKSNETFAPAFAASGATGSGAQPGKPPVQQQRGSRTVTSGDLSKSGASLADIASGAVKVSFNEHD